MTLAAQIFDGLLGLGVLWLAWQTLATPDLFRAIVLFIAFGLLISLAWVRLDAPDIALAEAAIGAGLTGALLLSAFAKLRLLEKEDETTGLLLKPGYKLSHWMLRAVLMLAGVGLGIVVLSLPPQATGLSAAVASQIESSGVSNPVTAVLLNFRGYDTLLEMAVFLLVVMGVWSLGDTAVEKEAAPGPILDILSRVLVPVMIVIAAYLLWVGAHAPGGAFQAGSIIGAAGVLLLLSGWKPQNSFMALPLRLVLAAGLTVFVIMAVVTLLIQGHLLQFPLPYAGTLILVLETVATLSIGATLTVLLLGNRPRQKESK